MGDLDRLAGDLSPKKRALLELLLKERARPAAAPVAAPGAAIPRRPAGIPAPLSFTQERLWFLDQLEPGNAAYNVPAAVRLLGNLDVAALARSLAAVVARHEVLRTRLVAVEGRPRQEILPALAIALPVVDLGGLPEARRQLLIDALAGEQTRRPFDLAAGPLLRIALLRLGPAEHAALLTIHHAASDTWSMGILVGELAAGYEAFLAGRPEPLPPLAVQFADFAAWQRGELAGEAAARELAFWKGALADLPEALELPADHPRPIAPRYRGAGRVLAVPAAVTEALRTLSRGERASLFMTLLAAWSALLSRLTHDDVVVGTPLANRNRPELERLIGPLLNTVLLRADLSGDPPFAELVRRVRGMAIEAFAHRDLPFERLVEELRPERSLAKNPLFQVDFILQNAPRTDLVARGLSFVPMRIEAGTAQLDLSLSLTELPGHPAQGLEGWLEYDLDLFEAATIDRLAAALLRLLAGAAAAPETRVSALPLLGDAEVRELLGEAGAPHPTAAPDLAAALAAQAGRAPDAVAVDVPGEGTAATEALSYGELARRAGRLARFLRGAGVGPEVPVGLFLGRSAELIVALWGVLEAGGAFLALDLAAPAERLAQILGEAAPPLVLTLERFRAALAEPALARLGLRTVCLDRLPSAAEEEILAGADPAAAAYLLYTSGSTGVPKGVVVPRGALAAYTAKAAASFGLTAADRVLQLAALSFDTSLEEIFPTLACGATLVLRTPSMLESTAGFWDACGEWGITVLDLPTAFWHVLVAGLEERGETLPRPVRLVVLGGERALPARVTSWLAAVDPAVRLLNTYGPTETTIVALSAELGGGTDAGREVAIGRPLAGVTASVVDRFGGLLPFAVPGELALGGDGVARGYLANPELTARRFVPDPYRPAGRLYRTGDRVRHRPDGALEFLGRVDSQVKVRGFRVEPGEIEAVLAAQPEIAEAVVVPFSPRPGETRLAAYFVPRAGRALSVGELRARLAARLPDYLVPAAFVELASLPRSAAGKLLRRALPEPFDAAIASADPGGASYAAPSGAVEEVLAAAWAEVLGLPRVSATANLFELGAHSLLLTQVVSRIRQLFRVELPLKAVFEAPTVAGLARRVEAARREASGVELPPIVPAPRDRPLPLSFTQERMWFLQQLFPGLSAYNVPGAVHLRGALDVDALARSLSEIVRRHEIFRTTFERVDGEPVQVIAPPRPVALPQVDLTALPAASRAAEARLLVERESRRPFDLMRGPMLRLHLSRLAPEHHLLSVVTHHVTYDMWAREVFIRELATLYQALAAGEPSPLPELALQFADFALWQRGWMQGEVLARQLAFWRAALAGAPEALELPTDRPRPPMQTYGGARRYLDVPPAVGRALKELAQGQGTTVFMVLLAAFQTLLFRYAGQERIVVGMPIANRNRLEIEKLIGFFANALAIPADLAGDPAFTGLLAQARETALSAYAHQDLPFEYLVQELAPQRDLSRQPIFQVMFNYLQDYAAAKMELPAVSLEFEEVHNAGAPYDLFVSLWATGEGLRGSVDYNVDLFDAVTVDRLNGHFGVLLAGIAAAPGRRLAELPLLTAPERAALCTEWNDTRAAPAPGEWLWQRFAAQAERTPAAVALSSAAGAWRYGELAAAAERLAVGLAAAGVGVETVVPLLLERGARLVTAILALFRLGAAYLPLDPRHPVERHLTVLAQSRSRLLLVERELAPLVAEALAVRPLPRVAEPAEPLRLLEIEVLAEASGRLPALPCATGGELAYAIFTSGSTGVPKGAAVTGRGMLNHLEAKIADLGITQGDVVAQTAAQTFDISVWQMLAALTVGGRVHVFDDRTLQDPARLIDGLREERITLFEPVPSLLRVMVEELAGRAAAPGFPALRQVIPTGEALPPDLARQWLASYPAIPLVNAYGPTECADDVTHQRLAAPEAVEPARVPIGRPVINLRILVLDATGNLAPIGVPGELSVGGVGVGRGYLHDPRRTGEAFVPDPSSDRPGERLYRTGDLARRLPDGRLDLLGRIDHQVKVRGFRIELGEIEAALHDLAGIAEAVVLAVAGIEGAADLRLIAYYVAAPGAATSVAALRETLGLRLPEYMVPAAFLELAALPLSANGKVDRKALPLPDAGHFAAETAYLPPAGPTQVGMAEIWRDLLGVARVGAGDNFFHLGGHSLMATRLMSRVRAAFGVELPLSAIFEAPTLSGLAETLDVAQWGRESAALAFSTATANATATVDTGGGDIEGGDLEVGEL